MKNSLNRLKYYNGIDLIRILLDIFYTKIIFRRKAKIVRTPLYIRGVDNIQFGQFISMGTHIRIDAFNQDNTKSIIIGDNVEINDYTHIAAINKVEIGNNVLIASKVFISDHNHGYYGFNNTHTSPKIVPNQRSLSSAPISIKDNVWLGEFVSVLPGVTIGEGSIVGAMSVVSKDIPPYVIAAGIPAKVIKKYDFKLEKWVKV